MKNTLLRAAVMVAAAAVATATAAVPASADVTILGADAPGAIKDRYIVKLKSGTRSAASVTGKHGGRVRHHLEIINGYSAEMTPAQAKAVAGDPDVASVEQAQRVVALDTQTNPPNWGDDRIDQRDLPLNSSFGYPANPGQGAHVYVLDTGINANHVDFSGRIGAGADIVDNDTTPQDCHGHGTHVAGTAAGTSYGIAKKATVHAVRVLDCGGSGSNDDIIAGIDWVKANGVKPAVVNYSIGCSQRCTGVAVDNAVKALIASGVQFVQAAGNSTDDACYYSPQAVPEAVTVGNSNRNDARSSSSNHGTCLDLFAPGENIVSASHTGTTGSATMTGTSMASPHVAGAAALYLGQNPSATPAAVRDALVTNSTPGKLTGIGSSPNRLLYTAFMNGTTPPPTGCEGRNDTDYTVNDNATVESPITLDARCGTASASATVDVTIPHTYIGDLVVSLIGPDGAAYVLHDKAGGDADNLVKTFSVNLAGKAAAGTWKLRVQDVETNDTGRLDTWTLKSGATLGGGTTCATLSNGTDVAIADNSTVESSIASTCTGTASATGSVALSILHTYRGDLVIDLIAPDGSAYRIKNADANDSADNVTGSVAVDLSTESRAGTWKLRVQDAAAKDTGTVDSWSLTL
ncbi:S8 family serine peptidase [Actinosynnema sp. NPDC047251]|uniref:Putative secreted subtilisin-like serine protease n=1 Tax=Saccharothrix espanaensis (strain ATCC 51144 / DSM 44229 / JCM 9112 / NBRC 15066 / NRRL 15764) TaxID=1179773 RepID=K0JZH7_SACES|nr:S8 family serine peptidase [Saccharothrix espanaensis]CCH29673.1 putative secreted subtilisin-like serine protease [Saccharothrix espanaensis DSM 44229]